MMNYHEISQKKINCDFPSYNNDDYNDVMNNILCPTYPNEEQRIFFLHCMSRAMAGYIIKYFIRAYDCETVENQS